MKAKLTASLLLELIEEGSINQLGCAIPDQDNYQELLAIREAVSILRKRANRSGPRKAIMEILYPNK